MVGGNVNTVQSADKTVIAFNRSGAGPALVLVVGAFCDRSSTKTLAAGLGSAFTVYEYDRRGRGDSGEAGPYAIEREVDDLAAVIGAAGGTAFAFGHSSGGALGPGGGSQRRADPWAGGL
jgi:pimeloyl-ACP methyl ester carboxylesterase